VLVGEVLPGNRVLGWQERLDHGGAAVHRPAPADQRPAGAWATTYPSAASLEPGLFCLFLGLTGLLLTLVAVEVALRVASRSSARRGDPATWASAAHERRIAVPRDPAKRRWRLVAGRGTATRRLLAGDDCVSAVVFGPNGSGKTTSLIVPNVLDWDGPVVMTTAKPQDLEPVCTARAASGPVWVIAPGGAPGHHTVGWSPIAEATDEEAADRVAEWMVASSVMTDDPRPGPGRPRPANTSRASSSRPTSS
jgi:type IV secretion system protein VirD4